MGARVTLTVLIPPATPVEGAEIVAVNHDAWASSHREWEGRSESNGIYTWDNMDTGTLGDRYTFHVTYTDPEGVAWSGATSERIRRAVDLKVVLKPEFRKLQSISSAVEQRLSTSSTGRRLLAGVSELETVLKENLTQAALGLEMMTLENAVRLWMADSKADRPEWGSLGLSVVTRLKVVNDRLGNPIASRIERFIEDRNRAVHSVGKDALPQTTQIGSKLCLDVLEVLFSEPGLRSEQASPSSHAVGPE